MSEFIKRHACELTVRTCKNIKKVAFNRDNRYFDNLQIVTKDVPSCNILNYDETNLSNDPGV